MEKILQNRIKCNYCGDIMESTTVNDYVECSCGRVAVDGGLMYLRRIFLEETDFTELSELDLSAGHRACQALAGKHRVANSISYMHFIVYKRSSQW